MFKAIRASCISNWEFALWLARKRNNIPKISSIANAKVFRTRSWGSLISKRNNRAFDANIIIIIPNLSRTTLTIIIIKLTICTSHKTSIQTQNLLISGCSRKLTSQTSSIPNIVSNTCTIKVFNRWCCYISIEVDIASIAYIFYTTVNSFRYVAATSKISLIPIETLLAFACSVVGWFTGWPNSYWWAWFTKLFI